MKNTNFKYKLNFKTMKKGLLTLLAASLVFVGCQNYDDQFDDLNAQISALKSQVDGLSSLSGQVASLSGTISGLQAGIAAAASSSELTALSSSLTALQADVDAVQASIASTATASAVTALQNEIDAIETDLDELLSSSNIYSSDVTVTNATTLNSALALGNKINVLNATLTITGYAGMDYASVQTLVDRVNTTTGNIVYSAASSTGTEIVFNNLTSAGDIDVTQPGGYSFPKLSNAGTINLQNDYTTLVTNVSFPALTSVVDMQTEGASTDKFTVTFASATNVDFGALVNTPGTTVEITTKKNATLDLGSWNSKNAAGTYVNQTLTLNGPASFTNGTAAATFASTGLPTNTVGSHDGTINLTNVATAAIHNFRGDINVNAGVASFTGNNIVRVSLGSASGLTSLDLTMMRDNDPGLTAATVAADAKEANTEQDVSLSSTHAKLTTVKMRGLIGDFTADAVTVLETVDLGTADAFNVTVQNNTALTSYTAPAKAMDFTFDNNDLVTSLSAGHTTKTETGDKAATVSIDGNAELASITIGFDDVDALSITDNAKLTTLSGGTALKDNGASTSTSVQIYANKLTASLVRDTKEDGSATVTTGASSDTGSITTTSGIKDLDAFLGDAKAASGTVSVWFDTVSKLETQATYGGAYTDATSSLTAPSNPPTAAEAVDFGTNYSGYYAYMYVRDAVAGTTTGAISAEKRSFTWEIQKNATTGAEVTNLGAAEGFILETASGDFTFDTGDSYAGAAAGGTVSTVADLIGYMTAQTQSTVGANIDVTAAQDAYALGLYSVSYLNSTGANAVAGVVSTAGNLLFTFGSDEDGADSDATLTLTAALDAGDTDDDIADAVMTAINADGLYSASSAAGGNGTLFYVSKNVSGTGTMNTSPEITSFPSITFLTSSVTNTAILTPSGYDGVVAGSSVSAINSRGTASSFYSVSASAPVVKKGMRVTLTNNTGVAFSGVSFYGVGANSGTAFRQDLTKGNKSLANTANEIVAGVNMSTYVASTNEGPANYVAAFSDISSGTTSGAVTAVVTDRTTW